MGVPIALLVAHTLIVAPARPPAEDAGPVAHGRHAAPGVRDSTGRVGVRVRDAGAGPAPGVPGVREAHVPHVAAQAPVRVDVGGVGVRRGRARARPVALDARPAAAGPGASPRPATPQPRAPPVTDATGTTDVRGVTEGPWGLAERSVPGVGRRWRGTELVQPRAVIETPPEVTRGPEERLPGPGPGSLRPFVEERLGKKGPGDTDEVPRVAGQVGVLEVLSPVPKPVRVASVLRTPPPPLVARRERDGSWAGKRRTLKPRVALGPFGVPGTRPPVGPWGSCRGRPGTSRPPGLDEESGPVVGR